MWISHPRIRIWFETLWLHVNENGGNLNPNGQGSTISGKAMDIGISQMQVILLQFSHILKFRILRTSLTNREKHEKTQMIKWGFGVETDLKQVFGMIFKWILYCLGRRDWKFFTDWPFWCWRMRQIPVAVPPRVWIPLRILWWHVSKWWACPRDR